jgi:hypothetical protein
MIHLLLVCVLAFLCFRLLREKTLHKLLALSLAFAIFLWYLAPGIFVVAFPYETIASSLTGHTEDEFFFAYALEAGAVCLIIGALLLISRAFPGRQNNALAMAPGNGATWFILGLYSVAIVLYMLFGMVDYLEANAASLYEEKTGNSLLTMLRQFLAAAAVLLAVEARSRKKIFYAAFGLICADSILAVISGSRIALFMPLVILAFTSFDRHLVRRKNLVIAFVALVFTAAIIVPVATVIGNVRGQGLTISEIQDSDEVETDEGITFVLTNVASMVFGKFDSFSMGLTLLDRAGGPGAGGVTPYVGSALVFIPRVIWPGRPVAGSSDGTIYGHPTRIVPSVLDPGYDSFNVGISPLHIAVWQLGYLGALCFVIASTGYILFLNRLLKADFLSSTLAVFLLSIPSFHMLITSPDATVMQLALAVPLLLAIKLSRDIFVKGYA